MADIIINAEDFLINRIDENGNIEADVRLKALILKESVTDINWDGKMLFIEDIQKGSLSVPMDIPEDFVIKFSSHLADSMGVQFNENNPVLEAETEELRINIIHKSKTNTGYSVSIRKTPQTRRLSKDGMIKSNYCPEDLDNLMEACVKSGCNIVVCGLPGVGKTEYVKYLTKYIAPTDKAITIEDNLEIRYRAINPDKACVEMKVDDAFTYSTAIKACLRQFPKWIILSEARSKEIEKLLESLSTGCHTLTTLHTDDVKKVPDRVNNMSKNINTNDIYSFLDVAVMITRNHERQQWGIEQVAFFSRINDENKIYTVYENGRFISKELPPDIQRKFDLAGVENPLEKDNSNEL